MRSVFLAVLLFVSSDVLAQPQWRPTGLHRSNPNLAIGNLGHNGCAPTVFNWVPPLQPTTFDLMVIGLPAAAPITFFGGPGGVIPFDLWLDFGFLIFVPGRQLVVPCNNVPIGFEMAIQPVFMTLLNNIWIDASYEFTFML